MPPSKLLTAQMPAAISKANLAYLVSKTKTPGRWAQQGWLLPPLLGSRVSFPYLGEPSWMLDRSPNPGTPGRMG